MRTEPLLDAREKVALWLAPWLYVPYREAREEAFRDLAEVAYGSREAVWTSPRVLVKTALREARPGIGAPFYPARFSVEVEADDVYVNPPRESR